MLKSQHGLTHGCANLVALTAKHPQRAAWGLGASAARTAASAHDQDAGELLVAGPYAGAKQVSRPLYVALCAALPAFGPKLTFAPRQAIVSVRRCEQFALLAPSTASRLDCCIESTSYDLPGRWADS